MQSHQHPSQQQGQNPWNFKTVQALFEAPLLDLIFQAQATQRAHFPPNQIQLSTLLSIKTGACPEDCSYCPQSGHYNVDLKKEKLLDLNTVAEAAATAKANGATRFCMGAAWRNPPKKELPKVLEMIKAVKALGMESCVTLGMLDDEDTKLLKEAGLDYYNHNLDSSSEFYEKIITTRTYQDRLETLDRVQQAGINVCCGGILGMGETREDRINFLLQLARLPQPPQSIPINNLIAIKGTPLENVEKLDNFEFIRTIAVTRIMFPPSYVRLSAGREQMNDEMQALCFLAGANSVFYGDKLLVTKNPDGDKDLALFAKLGLQLER
jgi:biotin synthase